MDLACSYNNGVAVLLGNGDGTFQQAVRYGGGSIAIGDFDGNGTLDLVSAGGIFPGVSVLMGKGDGTYRNEPCCTTGGHQAPAVAVGDFNGDGKLDLAVTLDATVLILPGYGTGLFQQPVQFPGPMSYPAAGAAVGDFNGDGNLDLVVVSSGDVSVLLGTGQGAFQPPSTFNVQGLTGNTTFVAGGDFNGDGKLDLVVGSESKFYTHAHGAVFTFLCNGDGTFQAPLATILPSGADSVAVADFNGDGKLDLAVVNGVMGTYSILLGKGDGTFQPAATYAAGGTRYQASVAAGDFNGDGKPDLALASGSVIILLVMAMVPFALCPPSPLPICRKQSRSRTSTEMENRIWRSPTATFRY